MKIFNLSIMLVISAIGAIAFAAPDVAETSEVQIPAVQAPTNDKKIYGTLSVYPQAEYGKTEDVFTWTAAGINYLYSDKTNFAVKQSFETLTGYSNESITRQEMGDNNFRAAFTDFIISSSIPGIMGIESFPVSLDYRNMNADAIKVPGWRDSYALIEGNLSIPYAISSKVDFSLDTQIRHYIKKEISNTNRFLAVPTIGYAFNDTVRFYQSAGYVTRLKDNNQLRKNTDSFYLETGIVVTPIKNLSIKADVYQDKAFYASESSGADVTGFSLYTPTESKKGPDATADYVYYEAVISYKF